MGFGGQLLGREEDRARKDGGAHTQASLPGQGQIKSLISVCFLGKDPCPVHFLTRHTEGPAKCR